MVSAIERLRALARTASVPLSPMASRIMAETGLPVLAEAAPDPARAAIEAELRPYIHAGNFSAVATAFDQLFAARTFCGNGYRTYRVAQAVLLAPIEAAAVDDIKSTTKALQDYRHWWQQDRTSPPAAAILARALLQAATPPPHQSDLDDSAQSILAALRAHCAEARGVLAHAGPNGRKHWLWRQADLTLTFLAWSSGVEDDNLLLPAFNAVQKLDPYEFGIYDDRTVHLLPQWSGSLAAIDRFAIQSAKRTAAQFGDLLYARVYNTALGFEDPESTKVDPERLLVAFSDWYERFPSQALANRYAAHAHAFGDYATVRRLFRDTIREIHPAHWFDSDQPLEAWRMVAKRRPSKR